MSKINIQFNGKSYSIEEDVIAPATSELQKHLSTVMNGSGAIINLGGTAYNIDSSKLSAATNDFISHLRTIAGSGSKVVVNGVEYSIDSTKVSGAISELESVFSGDIGEEILEGDGAEYYTLAPTALSFRSTAPLNELQEVQINGVTVDSSNYTLEEGSTIVTFPIEYMKTLDKGDYEIAIVSDSKTVKGSFTVAAPDLNAYGFYYNQPYAANLPMFGGDTAFFVREDGTYDIITVGKMPDTGEYTMNGNNIVATHPMLGTITCTISSNGAEIFCNELQTAFKLINSTSIVADEDYIYIYKEDLGGYEVNCIDKTKAEYGDIKTGINGIDTVKLADDMFHRQDGVSHNLIYIDIPDSVVSIGESAFNCCKNLESVEIPNSVTSIGDNAFSGCIALRNINIPNSITSIGDNVFSGCIALRNINIPDSVTSIGDNAFAGCISLTSITIPDSVTSIGAGAFNACKCLTSITIPNSVTSIGGSAFNNCTVLKSITIPNSVTSIGDYTFYGCLALTSIAFDGTVSQWNAITKGESWSKNVAANYAQCSDGKVYFV